MPGKNTFKCLQTFGGEPQEFSALENAVQRGVLEGFHQVQHQASGCWMPFWLSTLMQASQGDWSLHFSRRWDARSALYSVTPLP